MHTIPTFQPGDICAIPESRACHAARALLVDFDPRPDCSVWLVIDSDDPEPGSWIATFNPEPGSTLVSVDTAAAREVRGIIDFHEDRGGNCAVIDDACAPVARRVLAGLDR